MNEHTLQVEYIETKNGNFNKITCPENHFITSWRPEDDILEFNASKVVCCPLKVDINSTYRCITDEEWLELDTRRIEAEKIKIEEDMKKIQNGKF